MAKYLIGNFKGPAGATGPQGEKGEKGADGYNPQRGVDYYTDADKAEIIADVLSSIPVAEGVSY